VYELMEGKEVNGRGVWQMAGGQEVFMCNNGSGYWLICTGKTWEREGTWHGSSASHVRPCAPLWFLYTRR
jgi:hypothetical protein